VSGVTTRPGERTHESLLDEALVDNVADQAQLTPSYLVFMATAGVLAAVGLLSNSVPILVGAMIVAPALAPLALVAFALVGGQPRLALRGLWVAVIGLVLATLFSIVTTWVMNATGVIPARANLLKKPLLEERVHPGWWSLAAAFAAGIAGIVALSNKKTDTLVGTVAALALVPAAGAAGIAFISGDPIRGLGGLLLLALNVGVIVAMGIVVLLVIAGAQRRKDGRGLGAVVRQGIPLVLLAFATVAVVSTVLALAHSTDKAPDGPPPSSSRSGRA
jgi:uncharacterized hydrophobic protein (TIGR00271 family)